MVKGADIWKILLETMSGSSPLAGFVIGAECSCSTARASVSRHWTFVKTVLELKLQQMTSLYSLLI
jgi:hypothetical protein